MISLPLDFFDELEGLSYNDNQNKSKKEILREENIIESKDDVTSNNKLRWFNIGNLFFIDNNTFFKKLFNNLFVFDENIHSHIKNHDKSLEVKIESNKKDKNKFELDFFGILIILSGDSSNHFMLYRLFIKIKKAIKKFVNKIVKNTFRYFSKTIKRFMKYIKNGLLYPFRKVFDGIKKLFSLVLRSLKGIGNFLLMVAKNLLRMLKSLFNGDRKAFKKAGAVGRFFMRQYFKIKNYTKLIGVALERIKKSKFVKSIYKSLEIIKDFFTFKNIRKITLIINKYTKSIRKGLKMIGLATPVVGWIVTGVLLAADVGFAYMEASETEDEQIEYLKMKGLLTPEAENEIRKNFWQNIGTTVFIENTIGLADTFTFGVLEPGQYAKDELKKAQIEELDKITSKHDKNDQYKDSFQYFLKYHKNHDWEGELTPKELRKPRDLERIKKERDTFTQYSDDINKLKKGKSSKQKEILNTIINNSPIMTPVEDIKKLYEGKIKEKELITKNITLIQENKMLYNQFSQQLILV